jgi:hypothetical protein
MLALPLPLCVSAGRWTFLAFGAEFLLRKLNEVRGLRGEGRVHYRQRKGASDKQKIAESHWFGFLWGEFPLTKPPRSLQRKRRGFAVVPISRGHTAGI